MITKILQEKSSRVDQESVERQQVALEKELTKVQNQLRISHKVRQRLNEKFYF